MSLHHLVRRRLRQPHPDGHRAGAAFHDDPVVSWIVPDEGRRRRDLPSLMRVFAARFQPHGENCVNETASGAAVWAAAGCDVHPEDDARFETALVTAAGPDVERAGQLAEAMERCTPPTRTTPDAARRRARPAGHRRGLGAVAGRARHRRRGRRAGLPRGDDAAEPALYERHGFEVAGSSACGLPACGRCGGTRRELKGVTGISPSAYGSFSSIWSPLQNVPGS